MTSRPFTPVGRDEPCRVRPNGGRPADGLPLRRALALLAVGLAFGGCGADPVGSGADTDVTGSPGVRWVEVAGNPIVDASPCPAWNCLGMTDPWIGRGPDGRAVLWVSAGGDAAEGGPVVARASGPAFDRLTFDPDAPDLRPAVDVWDRWRETVSLVRDSQTGRWRMWYLGYARSFFEDPALGQTMSEGTEGTSFPRPAEPIYRPRPGGWDGAFVTDPVAVPDPAGGWRLYYIGAGTTVGVGLLTSPDGTTWTPHPDNPLVEGDAGGWDQGFVGLEVIHHGGRWLMWYSGYREPLDLASTPIAIGLATSDDGVVWERHPANPVVEPGPPGAWNGLRIVSPSVHVEADGTLLMAVHGQSRADAAGASLGRIGLYRSPPER